jgi:DNA-binding GntR family transcriptional regulator
MPDSAPGRPTREGQNVSVVHGRLREEILAGNIPAGETSQVALARDFNIGRTPLREALRLLQTEGLVISEPNRRVRVADLTVQDAEELYMMRTALEAMAIRVTVPTITSDDIAQLEGVMAQMDHYMRTYDNDGLRQPHRVFHDRLVAGAGDRGRAAIAQLFDHAERYRRGFGGPTPEIWERRRAEHRAILDAVVDGDAELAAERLIGHYAATAGLVFEGLDPDFEPTRLRTAIRAIAPGAEPALTLTERVADGSRTRRARA